MGAIHSTQAIHLLKSLPPCLTLHSKITDTIRRDGIMGVMRLQNLYLLNSLNVTW